MADIALTKLTVAPKLAIEFFAVFSRLEYALKVVPSFRRAGDGEAKADWAAFTRALNVSFDPNSNPRLMEAFSYLTIEPIKRLDVQQGTLDWLPFDPGGDTPLDKVIFVIKQIRHNLFHGGKFALDPKASRDRDTQLLKYALVVLQEIRVQIPTVKEAYEV